MSIFLKGYFMLRYFLLCALLAFPCKAQQRTPSVVVTKVSENLLNPSIIGVGTFTAYNDVTLKAEFPGRVEVVHFKEGEYVKPGQKLFTFHNVEQKAKAQKAEAALKRDQNIAFRLKDLSERKFASPQDLEAAQTQAKNSEADLALAKDALDKTVVKAPFDGALSEKQVCKGSYLIEGDPMIRIQDLTPIRLKFKVPQPSLPLVKLENDVIATTDTYPGQTFKGKIETIEPAVDEETRSITIYAAFPNKEKLLIPGLFAHAEIQTNINKKSALFIPEQALIIRPTGSFVYKVVGNKVALTKVSIGQRKNDLAEVTSGLKKDEIIVLEGQDKIQDGGLIHATTKS